MSVDPDQYTELRLLLAQGLSDLQAKLTEHVGALRSDIRQVAASLEHAERTNEMRFRGLQEGQQRQAEDIAAVKATQAAYDRRISHVEQAQASHLGQERGSDRTRAQLQWAVGILVGLLTLVSIVAAMLAGGQ